MKVAINVELGILNFSDVLQSTDQLIPKATDVAKDDSKANESSYSLQG